MNTLQKSGTGALVASFLLAAAGSALGQTPTPPPGPPPSWDSLIPCAQKGDPVEGFKCYQAAMRAAGYAPNPEIAAAERRRKFGLSLPSIGSHKPVAKPQMEVAQATPGVRAPPPQEEPEDRVTVKLEQVALIPPLNRLLLITTEGGVWQQTDSETVSPTPKPGETMTIIRGKIGGYFCQFDRVTRVRCIRTH